MTVSLLATQRAWLAALQDPIPGQALTELLFNLSCGQRTAEQAFAVYVNNVRATLIQALTKSFPVTKRLMGTKLFGRAVLHSLKHFPPSQGDLGEYGENFPHSVQTVLRSECERDAERITKVAQFEWTIDRVERAPREPPIGLADLQSIPIERWPELRLRLVSQAVLIEGEGSVHQAVTETTGFNLRPDARFFLHSAGPLQKACSAHALTQHWLLIATDEQVDIYPLKASAGQWLEHIESGHPLEAATAATLKSDPAFDLLPNLLWLIGTQALTITS